MWDGTVWAGSSWIVAWIVDRTGVNILLRFFICVWRIAVWIGGYFLTRSVLGLHLGLIPMVLLV